VIISISDILGLFSFNLFNFLSFSFHFSLKSFINSTPIPHDNLPQFI
jgi:hypothetical protein